MGKGGRTGEDALFFSETRHPLTVNATSLIFTRLNTRAGITGKHISPSMLRDTFAVRFLQAGVDPGVLQKLLGLEDPVSVKRYQMAARIGGKGAQAIHEDASKAVFKGIS
jgi:site-specific recombinase XerD